MIVQTLSPDATSMPTPPATTRPASCARSSAEGAALRYPPFADLIRIVCSAAGFGAAHAAAAAIAERVDAGELLGPAPLFRIRNRERVQLVVKTDRRAEAIAQVGAAVEAVATDRAHRDVTLAVDVDPQ